MKLVFIRSKIDSTVYFNGDQSASGVNSEIREKLKLSAKAGSSSKNIIRGLYRLGYIESYEEWKFWDGPMVEVKAEDGMPVRLFPINQELKSEAALHYMAECGKPDILWIEGTDFPPYLELIFRETADCFKLVYSKEWRPWRVEALEKYDLCLVDEEWEVQKVRQYYPEIACGVWDKLIDYEHTHFPLKLEKRYDICYVAYLRRRKNHELLFRAMSNLKSRKLSCVCVGDNRKGYQQELERMASALGLDVTFTGEVSKEQVNRIINQSRMGVMCSTLDAAPRAILEYMAADVPVLVNAQLWAGCRYVIPGTGLVCPPESFHEGILEILDHPERFSPRSSYLKQFSFAKVMGRFVELLRMAGCPMRDPDHAWTVEGETAH